MKQGKLFVLKDLSQSFPASSQFSLFKRERDNSWDYKDTAASQGVYGIHPYPAMFHFLVVRRLIKDFSNKGDLVLDPFMGSGVSAVESLINHRHFIGVDVNPLAVLIAKVRATPLNGNSLLKALEEIIGYYQGAVPETIEFHNINYWFETEVIKELARLRGSILKVSPKKIQDFFKVAFSETVRRVSRTDYNEFKLIRRKEDRNFNVLHIFKQISVRNIGLLTEFYQKLDKPKVSLTLENKNILELSLPQDSIDLVVTSPPYGDSRTTVAYDQFSRLPLRWLGMKDPGDKSSLGSRAQKITKELPSEILYQHLSQIQEKNEKRAQEVFAFYFDLFSAIKIISKALKPKGRVCFVVGNRRVQGIELPTDKISADFFVSLGFKHQKTIVRAISNKRMPLKNSPSNIKGEKDSTMRFEYIVLLQKN